MTWSGEQTVHVQLDTSTPLLNTIATTSPPRPDRMSASRQKSCNACVRGKRRCDKRTPNCTRCAARGLDCVYQRLPPSSNMADMPAMPDFDLSFDMEGISSDSSPGSLQADIGLQIDPVLDFSIADLVSDSSINSMSPGNELWTLPQDFGASKMDLPPLPTVPRLPLRDISLLDDPNKCEALNVILTQIYDPNSRIGCVLKKATEMHLVFVKTRAMPFMHPRLWSSQPPKIIMAAFAAATAQASSSPQNKGWTCKLVMDAARDVHREGELADTPAQKLARVQASLVVLGIKMFDGDMTMRCSAEREISILVDWAKDLLEVLRQMDDGKAMEPSSDEQAPKSWDDWILMESIRRTLVWAFAFSCFISILQSADIPFQQRAADMPYFTASRHLWEASSSVEFYRAWREKPRFNIKMFGFGEFWQYAQPEDLDEFTRLLLVSQIGPDVLEQFFSEDSSLGV